MAKKVAASTTAVDPGVLLQLDPSVILADDNTRFNLKESRVDSLAKSITERGEVMEPVEVEPLAAGSSNGHLYRLTTGFYRLAAVSRLNSQGAGLSIPALVRPTPTPQERLRRQLAENMERENQSPMDVAIAIKKLMDNGMSKMEVRELFSRPGGRKGNKTQPASNSFMNMHLSFLTLPKSMQGKIHDGVISVSTAYELTKVPAEKRDDVLARAEKARQLALAREEREEERLLAQEKRQKEEQAKRDAMLKEATDAETILSTAVQTLGTATETTKTAHSTMIGKHADAASKKAATTAFREAEKARLTAEADEKEARKVAEGARMRYEKYITAAASKPEPKQEAAAPSAKKDKGTTPADIKKAAAAEGVSSSYVMLNIKEIRQVVDELDTAGSNEKVRAIGVVLKRCFGGEITEKELYKELVRIVG